MKCARILILICVFGSGFSHADSALRCDIEGKLLEASFTDWPRYGRVWNLAGEFNEKVIEVEADFLYGMEIQIKEKATRSLVATQSMNISKSWDRLSLTDWNSSFASEFSIYDKRIPQPISCRFWPFRSLDACTEKCIKEMNRWGKCQSKCHPQ